MTTNTLPARDVAFLTALADFLLASGSDRAADAIYSVIAPDDGAQPVNEWAEVFAGWRTGGDRLRVVLNNLPLDIRENARQLVGSFSMVE